MHDSITSTSAVFVCGKKVNNVKKHVLKQTTKKAFPLLCERHDWPTFLCSDIGYLVLLQLV